MEQCAVPILFGRDAILLYGAILNYQDEICTLHYQNTAFELQLCSRDSIRRDLLDAGESLDDEIPHILLSVQRSYLKGSGDRKEGRKEKRNKAYLVLLLVDETNLFL